MKAVFAALLAAVWMGLWTETGFAAPSVDSWDENGAREELSQYDFSEIDRYLAESFPAQRGNLSFAGLTAKMAEGKWADAAGTLGRAVGDELFGELKAGISLMGQILILGIVGAFFSNFSSIFSGSQIAESGFYVTYLLVFTFLAASFLTGISVAAGLMEAVLEFMKALAPAYFLAVAVSGSSMTSMALYPFTLGVIAVLEWVFPAILLPLVRVDVLLVMAGHMMKENVFSRMKDLLETGICWAMRTIFGVVLGFQLIQGMVLPFADSMKTGTLVRAVGLIPGLGNGAATVSQLLLGSGVLIKNAMGAAAMVLVFALAAVPVLKLFILTALYQGTAAFMQPVCDRRLVSCIYEVGGSHRLLLKMSLTAVLLFVLSLAVVSMGSNTAYYSG